MASITIHCVSTAPSKKKKKKEPWLHTDALCANHIVSFVISEIRGCPAALPVTLGRRKKDTPKGDLIYSRD